MNTKLIKLFSKATSKNYIKPEINAIYCEVEDNKSFLVSTDSYRLHKMQYMHGFKESTIFDHEEMRVILGQYPEYKKIIPVIDEGDISKNEIFTDAVLNCKVILKGTEYYKIPTANADVHLNVKYTNEAIDFLLEYKKLFNREDIYFKIDGRDKPTMFYIDKNTFALVMPLKN